MSIFIYVWSWHFSDRAQRLPGAQGFGWFFRYVTFWGWTLQTVQFSLVTIVMCLPSQQVRSPAPVVEWQRRRALMHPFAA